jgi:mono/diheme cytochrome c family protein
MRSGRQSEMRGLLTFFSVALIAMVICGCNYERMNDQDAFKTFKKEIPVLDERTVPAEDGFQILARADAESLRNPLPPSKESIEKGRLAYGYFCIQCHGPRLDGRGTVGQSFAPPPADLVSPAVLSKSDGLIYSRMRLGFGRHPALYSTVTADDSWAIINYMRSLGRSP